MLLQQNTDVERNLTSVSLLAPQIQTQMDVDVDGDVFVDVGFDVISMISPVENISPFPAVVGDVVAVEDKAGNILVDREAVGEENEYGEEMREEDEEDEDETY